MINITSKTSRNIIVPTCLSTTAMDAGFILEKFHHRISCALKHFRFHASLAEVWNEVVNSRKKCQVYEKARIYQVLKSPVTELLGLAYSKMQIKVLDVTRLLIEKI